MDINSLEDSPEELKSLKTSIKTFNFDNILQKDGWTNDGYSFSLSIRDEIKNDEEKTITLDTSDTKAKAEYIIPKEDKIFSVNCSLKDFNSNNNIILSNGRYYKKEYTLDTIIFVPQNKVLTINNSENIPEKKSGLSKGAIIGIVIGICVVIILVTVIIILFKKGYCSNSNKNSSLKN